MTVTQPWSQGLCSVVWFWETMEMRKQSTFRYAITNALLLDLELCKRWYGPSPRDWNNECPSKKERLISCVLWVGCQDRSHCLYRLGHDSCGISVDTDHLDSLIFAILNKIWAYHRFTLQMNLRNTTYHGLWSGGSYLTYRINGSKLICFLKNHKLLYPSHGKFNNCLL